MRPIWEPSPIAKPYETPSPNPPTTTTAAVPASVITVWSTAQRSRGRPVDSGSSTRPVGLLAMRAQRRGDGEPAPPSGRAAARRWRRSPRRSIPSLPPNRSVAKSESPTTSSAESPTDPYASPVRNRPAVHATTVPRWSRQASADEPSATGRWPQAVDPQPTADVASLEQRPGDDEQPGGGGDRRARRATTLAGVRGRYCPQPIGESHDNTPFPTSPMARSRNDTAMNAPAMPYIARSTS